MLKSIIANNDQLSNGFFATQKKSCLKYDINVVKMLLSIIANNDQLFNDFLQHKNIM